MSSDLSQEKMRDAWDREYAEVHAYTTSYRLDFDRSLHFLLAYLEGRGEDLAEPVLDCGCGVGRNTLPLARSGHRVFGLEHSTVALGRLLDSVREEGLDDLVTATQHDLGEPLPIESCSMGTLLDITAVDNLVDPMRRRGYGSEVARVLRPGGLALVVTFATDDGYYGQWHGSAPDAAPGVVEDPNTGIRNQLFTHETLASVFSPPLQSLVRGTLVFLDDAAGTPWTRRFLVHLYQNPETA
jgi:SAM-dependent methyltransferase